MIKTKGVAHFTLPVTDTVRSMAFYTENLGMTPIQVNHERGMVFLDCGGDCLILAKSDARIDPADLVTIARRLVRRSCPRRRLQPRRSRGSTCSSLGRARRS